MEPCLVYVGASSVDTFPRPEDSTRHRSSCGWLFNTPAELDDHGGGWLVSRRLATREERGGSLRIWVVRDEKELGRGVQTVFLLGTTFDATYFHFAHSFIHPKPFKRVHKQKTDAQSDFRDDEERFLELRVVG